MSDVSTVKAEIKAWERSFKASNGRDPSIQDIKDLPDIAAKYKLYKKLSKTVAESTLKSSSAHTSSEPPSTPPRSRPRAHQLVQPRVIETTAPLSSFNPFSPQKNKGKESEREKVPQVKLRSNLTGSPFKPKTKAPYDPFPILDSSKPSTSSHTPSRSPPPASSALSRARKRLRGDPVSPSPNKEKRRRIGSQLTLPFTSLAPESSDSDANAEIEANSSFITDSPVKAPSGAKSFKLLFDETAEPKGAPANGRSTTGRTKTQSTSRGLFGVGPASGQDDDALWNVGSKTKVTLFKPYSASTSESAHVPKGKSLSGQSQITKSSKRPLSDSDTEDANPLQQLPPTLPTLIPPSPPAQSSIKRQKQFNNTKGKAKAEPSRRKKAKTSGDDKMDDQDEDSDDDSDTMPTNVKIVNRTQGRLNQTLAGAGDESDPDLILGYPHRVAPRGHEAQLSVEEQEGRVEVDLPDKLRRVLALDTTELKTRDSRGERLVKGLVLGQRAGHYDPVKGGEIWDVGEDDARVDDEEETRRDTEGEDDWEGEPVPWEVGEL